MHNISLFIYLAQVCGSIGELFMAIGVILLIALMLFFWLPRIINGADCREKGDRNYLEPPPFRTGWVIVSVLFMTLSNLTPTSHTLYAIAAAEVGTQIVNSDISSDAKEALHQWIKKQIEPPKQRKD